MPHEATVDHNESPICPLDETYLAFRQRVEPTPERPGTKRTKLEDGDIQVPRLYAQTPQQVTHTHDEDDSDEESASSAASNASLEARDGKPWTTGSRMCSAASAIH